MTHKIYTPAGRQEITPIVEILNHQIVGTVFNRNIHKISIGEAFTLTADCDLPDNADLTMIIERVINATQVVDDERFNASIFEGKLKVEGAFATKGNYLLTSKRTNEGLDRLGFGVHLAFGTIEFNVV